MMQRPYFSCHQLSFLSNGPYSLYVQKGECVGVKGPSGIGKTQLFRALSDLIVSQGDVLFDGKDKDSISAVQWRSQVSMLPTDSVWWYDDVGAHFPSADAKEFLKSMCPRVGLPQEIINWQVSRLSTGEKQRLALIRSLQVGPAVLLLDEPTSALDQAATESVENLLLDLCKTDKLTLMWVSHDDRQLDRVSDRLLLMGKTSIDEIE